MNVEIVICYILYQKKIDIGLKIFEYVGKICYEMKGFPSLSP